MREWYSAPELAGLPGLPRTEFRVRAKAAREGWECRERESGKGREYHITELPEGAYIALKYKDKHSKTQTSDVDTCGAPVKRTLAKPSISLTTRREILAEYARHLECYRLPPRAFATAFVRAYNAHDPDIAVSPSTRAAVPTLSTSTFNYWLRQIARGQQAHTHGGKRTPALIEPGTDLYTFIVGCISGKPHVDTAQVTAGMRARFASAATPLPSERSVRRFISRYRRENAPALLASANPDAYRSKHLPAFGDCSAGVAGLNAQWQADATIGDIEIITPDGRRWAIVGIIDVWSRRAMLHLTPTVSGAAYGAAYRKALLKWGVPAEIVTDHGAAEISQYIELLTDDLGIALTPTRAYSPELKGFIERFLGTMSHQCLEMLPGYVGHSVADRQAIRSRKGWAERYGKGRGIVFEAKMTPEALQAHLDGWCEHVYGTRVHTVIGTSPALKAAEWTRPVKVISDVRALDALLAPLAGTRRVLKKGIRVAGGWFIAPELGAVMGAEVIIRHDPVDMGRVAVYLAATREFIAEAVCAERAGADRQAIAIEARRRHAVVVAESRAQLRAAARAAKPERIAEELVAAGRGQTVVPLPPRTTNHTTPAIEQAGRAARAGEITPPKPLTPAQEALQRRIAAHPLAARDRAADELAAKRARFARAQALLAEQAAGAVLDAADARWLSGYRGTAEFRALARLAEDGTRAAAG